MNILAACEYSGAVRRAFALRGHHATSCDLLATDLPCEGVNEDHYQGDLQHCISDAANRFHFFDALIAFPPCTRLCVSGARWFKDYKQEQEDAIFFFNWIVNLPIEKIAIENPIGIMSTRYRKPDQIIQPWQFGHGETKATCLWLKNLPKLTPTNIVDGREARIHKMAPGPNRAKERSRTYQGIANAMAAQWGQVNQAKGS